MEAERGGAEGRRDFGTGLAEAGSGRGGAWGGAVWRWGLAGAGLAEAARWGLVGAGTAAPGPPGPGPLQAAHADFCCSCARVSSGGGGVVLAFLSLATSPERPPCTSQGPCLWLLDPQLVPVSTFAQAPPWSFKR